MESASCSCLLTEKEGQEGNASKSESYELAESRQLGGVLLSDDVFLPFVSGEMSECLSLFHFTRVMRGNFLLFRKPNDVRFGFQHGALFGFRFLMPGVMHTPK